MAGETANIGAMAEKISDEIFKWFKWELVGTTNQNFCCIKKDEHQNSTGNHPTDVVFRYFDPYLNRFVYFNTDLKSYAAGSITATSMRNALVSMARSIDCAESSSEWQERYCYAGETFEVRGLLFVYNHDGKFDQHFYDVFSGKNKSKAKTKGKSKGTEIERGINIANLPIKRGQKIHIVEPRVINYLSSVINDIKSLCFEKCVPQDDFQYYYPDLILHKVNGDPDNMPATIEALTGPFFIIKHGPVIEKSREGQEKRINDEGYVIYYNGEGANELEFVYIFDTLSKFQLLDGKSKIRLRLANPNRYPEVRSVYERSKHTYAREWGFDDYKKGIIDNIEFHIVNIYSNQFSDVEIGWRL
ncbi:TPA: hypothetical protein ACS8BP_001274 [Providencia alcalifaciens]